MSFAYKKTITKCSRCENEIDNCAKCGDYFRDQESILCHNVKHYHNYCIETTKILEVD
jgi:hypothetical protein